MKNFVTILLLAATLTANAQQTEGMVTYERTQHWTKIISRLTFLSKEEKDRAAQTWKNEDGWKTKMKLLFSPSASLYTYLTDQGESEDGSYSWRNDEFLIYRNFDKEHKTDIMETLGKTYIVDDSLHTPVWKIGNQLKDVAGYICLRADTYDPVRNQKITAWFAQDIPVPAGPERYAGLPGVILEMAINDDDVVIEATKVEFKSVAKDLTLPKTKGKKINDGTYDALIRDHINTSMKAQRNPFWAIRY